MKLVATIVPYSSTVGGGLALVNGEGQVQYMVSVFGASLNKEVSDQITRQLASLINNHGPLDIKE